MSSEPFDTTTPGAGEELLRCPFCTGHAEIVQIGNEHTAKRGFEVRCIAWGCSTKKRAMVIRQPLEKARAFAIKAWNTRPDLSGDAGDEHERIRTTALAIMKRHKMANDPTIAILIADALAPRATASVTTASGNEEVAPEVEGEGSRASLKPLSPTRSVAGEGETVRQALSYAADVRWEELAEGSDFTAVDRIMLRELHERATKALTIPPAEAWKPDREDVARFDEWIRELDEEVIQGEFGYEEGEFGVYPEAWRPMFDEGLTPMAAFRRSLNAHAEQRAEEDQARKDNWSRIQAEDAALPAPTKGGA